MKTPQQVAQIIAAAQRLKAEHGILVTVPVPEADELPPEVAENAIEQATREAHENHIQGREVTPFVLNRVVELTEGRSKQANTALLINNARTAAQIANALKSL